MAKDDQKPEFVVCKLDHKELAYVIVVFNANGPSKWVGWLLSVPEMFFFDHGFTRNLSVQPERQGSVANDYGKESKKYATGWARTHLNDRLRDLIPKGKLDGISTLRPPVTENFEERSDSKAFLRDRILDGIDEEREAISKFKDALISKGVCLPASFSEMIGKSLKEQAETSEVQADFRRRHPPKAS